MAGQTNQYRKDFQIECMINGQDYTSNLERFRIMSSANTMYPCFVLEFLTEGEHIINQDIFGKDDIDITLTEVGEEIVLGEQIQFKLVYLSSEGLLLKNKQAQPLQEESDNSYPEVILISCVLKEALENLSTHINYCFQEDFNKPPIEAVKTIIKNFLPGMKNNIKDSNHNTSNLPRTFNCPRMAFSDFIRFINNSELGGLYNSPYIAFHGIDEFYMHSINHEIKQTPNYTIHLMPIGESALGILEKTTYKDDQFYTKIPIQITLRGQVDVLATGGKITSRIDPSDDLFQEKTYDINDIINNNTAVTSDNQSEQINKSINEIERYIGPMNGGYDEHDNYMKIKLAKEVTQQSEILIFLSRRLNIRRLMNPGKCMELKTYSVDYVELQGKYINVATNIEYRKGSSDVFTCTAILKCVRSNIKEA